MILPTNVSKFTKRYLPALIGLIAFSYVAYTAWTYLVTLKSSRMEIVISPHLLRLVSLSVVCYFLNWYAEAYKWKISIQKTIPISIHLALKSVFKGISYGIATPNRLGEFAGRVTLLPFDVRKYAIGKHVILSFSQAFITVCWGMAALVLSPYLHINEILNVLFQKIGQYPVITAVIVIVSVTGAILIKHSTWFSKHIASKIKKIIPSMAEFISYLLLSQIRYMAFIAQYVLLFAIFEVELSMMLVWHICLMLLLITYIPSTFLTQLGIRGSVALFCLSPFGIHPVVILLVTTILWVLNAAIPAMLGTGIKSQLFRKTQVI